MKSRFVKTGAILLSFLLIAFLVAGGNLLYNHLLGSRADVSRIVLWNLIRWMPWAFFTPVIVRLAGRFPMQHGYWLKSLPVHLGFSIVFTLVKFVLYVLFDRLVPADFQMSFHYISINSFQYAHYNILVYWIILGFFYINDYRMKDRSRELRNSALQAQLSKAQLDLLKMQLQPHFLFNTLHMISTLIHKDPAAADKMIFQLSRLLRTTLDYSDVHEISLEKELEFLSSYLDIEKTRFRDRLKIKMDIADETLDALVPSMVLQPLVENAIQHGIAHIKKTGCITIQSLRLNDRLRISIRDNGKGLESEGQKDHKGLGLTNTEERLRQLYGERFSLRLLGTASKGVETILEIPFHMKNDFRLKEQQKFVMKTYLESQRSGCY